MTPPVTVIVVPLAVGPHGYGCKTDGRHLYIPYNKLIADSFDGIQTRTINMLRDRFNSLPVYEEQVPENPGKV